MICFYGCVDVPSDAPEFPDFRTQARYIQADAALGSAQIMVDGSSVATVDFSNATSYMDLPAGNRNMQVQGDAAASPISLQSDANVTIIVFPKDTPTAARFRAFRERQSFQSVPADTALVRVIHAAATGVNYDLVDASDTSVLADNLALRGNSGYFGMDAGTFTLGVVEHGTTTILASADVTIADGQSFTAVIFADQSGGVLLGVFQDR